MESVATADLTASILCGSVIAIVTQQHTDADRGTLNDRFICLV
jgi:hypothetical protein